MLARNLFSACKKRLGIKLRRIKIKDGCFFLPWELREKSVVLFFSFLCSLRAFAVNLFLYSIVENSWMHAK